jgi:hypothetical protein
MCWKAERIAPPLAGYADGYGTYLVTLRLVPAEEDHGCQSMFQITTRTTMCRFQDPAGISQFSLLLSLSPPAIYEPVTNYSQKHVENL